MYGKILVGAAVWLASNRTGRVVASKGAKILSRVGGRIVNSMPAKASEFFNSVDAVLCDTPPNDQSESRE